MGRVVVMAIGLGLFARAAVAQCTYDALSSGVSVPVATTPTRLSFNQTNVYWTAVGIRSEAGTNWDLELYQSTAASPACVAGLLGSSARATGVDFVIGDFNSGHDPLGLHYPQAVRQAGSGAAVAEWDDGAHTLFVNNPLTTRTTDAGDVLEVWDAALTAGVTYTFTFTRSGADVKLLLFQSGAGPYWAARAGALWEATATRTFTPSQTGYYGVVVVNDNGASGNYTLGVGTCTTPVTLNPGVATSTAGFAERYFTFNQSPAFWMAIGVRGASADWNLETYANGSGGSYPVCLSGEVAASTLAAPSVDFIVGNFNNKLIGTFYARAHMNQGLGSGSAMVEWDSGTDFLAVGDSGVSRPTGSTDVLESWDAYLDAGASYQVRFITYGANLKLFVFDPALSWGRRADALATFSGAPGPQLYSSTKTGWHSFVVVNENGASGSYQLRLNAGALSADVGGRPPTELAGLQPNPAFGSANIAFSLHDAARVGFELLDVAGRRAAELPEREWGPGRWTTRWRPAAASGNRLAPGVYFLRMRVDGHAVGLRKVTLLD